MVVVPPRPITISRTILPPTETMSSPARIGTSVLITSTQLHRVTTVIFSLTAWVI